MQSFAKKDLPRGNTQKGVNQSIITYLLSHFSPDRHLLCFDAPCGAGEFLSILQRFYPNASLWGTDIQPLCCQGSDIRFTQTDLSRCVNLGEGKKFELITSISGIMMFGNTQSFLEKLCNCLIDKGVLIVSNDNSFTIRDRLSYLFLGRLRRFKLLFEHDEGLTQFVPQQEIYRLLTNNGVVVKSIVYTSLYVEDLLFLPFFLLIYPFQWWYIKKIQHPIPCKLKWEMFGWKSLLYRHYYFIGEKTDNP
jgi:trans-aconitate methyltransferase